MKNSIIFISLIAYIFSLNAMDNNIVVEIQAGAGVSMTQERLARINSFQDKNNNVIYVDVRPNQVGRYDITHLIKAEHTLTMQDAAQLVVEARRNGREEGINSVQQIPFVIDGCKKYSNLENILYKIDNEYKLVNENNVRFKLSVSEIDGKLCYDLTTFCDKFWDTAWLEGFSTSQEAQKKMAKVQRFNDKQKKKKKNSESQPSTIQSLGYSGKQLVCSFGLGAGCIGLIWWLKSKYS